MIIYIKIVLAFGIISIEVTFAQQSMIFATASMSLLGILVWVLQVSKVMREPVLQELQGSYRY